MTAPDVGPMSRDDVADVVRIHHDAFPEARSRNAVEVRLRIEEELTRSWSRLYVSREAGKAVAFVSVWEVADEVHILDVATAPEARRRGHARTLVEHVLHLPRQQAVRLFLLEVRASNEPAIALYRRFGFDVARVRTKYYPDGEDALEMILDAGSVPRLG